ncbi:hypothetical protein NXX33_22050 [Bacteroides fragilis]|nr:hypothetical protein [Bacteroides fragilis]
MIGWIENLPNGIIRRIAITNYSDALTARTGMYDGIQGNSMLHPTIMLPVCFITAMFVLTICRQELKVCVLSSCYEMLYTVDDALTCGIYLIM